MGYGAAGTGIGKDLGFREIVPQCEPGPDFEACRQETIVEGSAVVLVVVAAVVLVHQLLELADLQKNVPAPGRVPWHPQLH